MLKYFDQIFNCDVITAQANVSDTSSGYQLSWSDVRLAYRTPLSDHLIHINSLTGSTPGGTDDGAEGEGDERTCRICHMTERETPTLRMLRPCLCTGSLSLVHLQCLNQWRSTSAAAQYKCSVCKYEYKIKKSFLATLLLNENFIFYSTYMSIFVSIYLLGWLIRIVDALFVGVDVFKRLYTYTNHVPIWRTCPSM